MNLFSIFYVLFVFMKAEVVVPESSISRDSSVEEKYLNKNDFLNFEKKNTCPLSIGRLRNSIYILYDVNPSEGFNLRRDVYIRLAVSIRQLQQKEQLKNLRLVLPLWPHLYHWKSYHIEQQNLAWDNFFDLESLRRYVKILDFPEFLSEYADFGLQNSSKVIVNQVFQLQHFEEMFENGVFHDKFEFSHNECRMNHQWQSYYPQLVVGKFTCLRFQGSASMLQRVIQLSMKNLPNDDPKIFVFLNAEIVLHEHWGDKEFWRARRSMRFATSLMRVADIYRLNHFNSTNKNDNVQRPPMWEMEQPKRNAIGGSYLCGHLRRGDFLSGREKTTPTLRSVAMQIKQKLQELNLTKVYLATDATAFELKNLRSHFQGSQGVRLFRFAAESLQQKAILKDGGIAIVDQIICAHAKYFIGTYESTFTYRIYEEREILGFSRETTFNTFCKNENLQNCAKNSVWPIVY